MSRVEWRDGAAMTGTRQPYPIVAKLPVVITNQMIEVDRRMIEDIGINHLSDDGKCRFAIGQCRARSVAGERSLEQTNLSSNSLFYREASHVSREGQNPLHS